MDETEYPGMIEPIYPDIAANFRRLSKNLDAQKVFDNLKRHGASDHDIEILLRTISSMPRDWSEENEPWTQTTTRRARMAKNLRALASEVDKDPDLRGFAFGPGGVALNVPDADTKGLTTLSSLLKYVASTLVTDGGAKVQTPEATILTGVEFERQSRPKRQTSLQSYALRRIFDLLEPYFGHAPNKATTTLASVLLNKKISPSAVTQLRKEVRRPHYRDKE